MSSRLEKRRAILLSLMVLVVCSARATAWQADEPATTLKPVVNADATGALSMKEIYRRGLRHAAFIVAVNSEKNITGQATGWLLDKERKLLITNNHVAIMPGRLMVFFPQYNNGRPVTERSTYLQTVGVRAETLYTDSKLDLAVLKLESVPETATPAVLADESPSPGDVIFSIGNPGDQALWDYTTGTVRQVYRAKLNKPSGLLDAVIIETQSPINHGDSGGPALDDQAKLIGVVTAFMSQQQLVSVFIDVSEVKKFTEKAIKLSDPQTPEQFVERGNNAKIRKQVDAAIRDFTSALRLKPNHAPALAARGECFVDQRDYQTALQDYKEAIASDSTYYAGYSGRANIYRMQKKYDEALADCTTAIRLRADYYYPVWLRGLIYLDKQNPTEALDDFNRSVRLSAGSSFAEHRSFLYRGKAQEALGNNKAALDDYVASIKANDTDVDAYKLLGDLLLNKMSAPKDALDVFNEALKKQPNFVLALVQRGRAHMALNQPDPAFKDFNDAVKGAEKLPSALHFALLERGIAFESKGDLKSALNDYQASIKADASDTRAYTRLGDLYLNRLNDSKDAVVCFTDAIKRQPKLVYAFVERGRAYLAMDQLELALSDLNEAVTLDPNVASSYDYRGDIFLARREFDAALRDYTSALKLDDKNPIYHFDVASALAAKGDYRGAIKNFDAAITLAPKAPGFYLQRAISYFQLGDVSRSKADMDKAASLDEKFKGMEIKRRYSDYLRVTNTMKEPLELYIQYYTPTENGGFHWFPNEPGQGEAIKVLIEPQKTTYIVDSKFNDMRIKGAKFRVWGRGTVSGTSFTTYKDKDLNAAPPEGYVAADYRVFEYTVRE
jgi:tetratricopeptide (TPR) repeat protein